MKKKQKEWSIVSSSIPSTWVQSFDDGKWPWFLTISKSKTIQVIQRCQKICLQNVWNWAIGEPPWRVTVYQGGLRMHFPRNHYAKLNKKTTIGQSPWTRHPPSQWSSIYNNKVKNRTSHNIEKKPSRWCCQRTTPHSQNNPMNEISKSGLDRTRTAHNEVAAYTSTWWRRSDTTRFKSIPEHTYI